MPISEKALLLILLTSPLLAEESRTPRFIITNEEIVFHTKEPRWVSDAQEEYGSAPVNRKDSEPASISTWNCQNAAHPFFMDLRHREEKGIGYSKGYSSADLFLSHMTETWLTPFFDLRGHYFNDEKYAANGGFGLRDISQSLQVVFGVNIFYDWRQIQRGHFQQVGAGIEVLGKKWDFRVNGYLPIIRRRKSIVTEREPEAGGTEISSKVIYNFIGGDIEMGRTLIKCHDLHLKATGGSYYLNGLFNKQVIGGFLRLSGYVSPYVAFEGQGSYDPHFKWIGQGQLSLVIPFGRRLFDLKKGGCPNERYLPQERLLEQVSRFEIIPTSKHHRKFFKRS
ncbi:MAG: inverse autotransporter beta domain-containing protein [Chlamydiales bacterium]|nr:inverse autotransporter beta domain-containing protein [Chlamydiales bacterium]